MDEPARWRRTEATLWRAVLDDVVIMASGRPEPFALSGGLALWDLLGQPRTQVELAVALVGEERRESDLEGALAALLAELVACGAIERLPG